MADTQLVKFMFNLSCPGLNLSAGAGIAVPSAMMFQCSTCSLSNVPHVP
jgi:hypothetical protein